MAQLLVHIDRLVKWLKTQLAKAVVCPRFERALYLHETLQPRAPVLDGVKQVRVYLFDV
jgi:hypothetical protein